MKVKATDRTSASDLQRPEADLGLGSVTNLQKKHRAEDHERLRLRRFESPAL